MTDTNTLREDIARAMWDDHGTLTVGEDEMVSRRAWDDLGPGEQERWMRRADAVLAVVAPHLRDADGRSWLRVADDLRTQLDESESLLDAAETALGKVREAICDAGVVGEMEDAIGDAKGDSAWAAIWAHEVVLKHFDAALASAEATADTQEEK